MLYSFFFFKHKTEYDMRISDWSSDVCSSDLATCRKSLPRRDGTVSLRPVSQQCQFCSMRGSAMAVHVERKDAVTTIILDRPAARNAVDRPTADALRQAFKDRKSVV